MGDQDEFVVCGGVNILVLIKANITQINADTWSTAWWGWCGRCGVLLKRSFGPQPSVTFQSLKPTRKDFVRALWMHMSHIVRVYTVGEYDARGLGSIIIKRLSQAVDYYRQETISSWLLLSLSLPLAMLSLDICVNELFEYCSRVVIESKNKARLWWLLGICCCCSNKPAGYLCLVYWAE